MCHHLGYLWTLWAVTLQFNSIQFNSIRFISVRLIQKRRPWPTGYRTCQFHLTPSIYIKIYYNTYKQPKIKNTSSHCRISGSQKFDKYLLIQTYISVIQFYNMLLFKIN
jgi:hypothetical protein